MKYTFDEWVLEFCNTLSENGFDGFINVSSTEADWKSGFDPKESARQYLFTVK